MIYVASPYSHPEFRVREQRYLAVLRYVHACLDKGELVFSPIVYTHPLVCHGKVPFDYAHWRPFDMGLMRGASLLRVLKLDGWQESIGVADEIQGAKRRKIRIEYVEEPAS